MADLEQLDLTEEIRAILTDQQGVIALQQDVISDMKQELKFFKTLAAAAGAVALVVTLIAIF